MKFVGVFLKVLGIVCIVVQIMEYWFAADFYMAQRYDSEAALLNISAFLGHHFFLIIGFIFLIISKKIRDKYKKKS